MNKRAFTLIELVIVIVIVGITAGMAVPTVLHSVDSWLLVKEERDLLANSRVSLNRMVREIRQIKDTDSITTFTSGQFAFVDIDDNAIDFSQSGNQLLRNSDVLTRRLKTSGGLTFTYLDSDDIVTADKNDVYIVRINLVLESNNVEVDVRSAVNLRNR